MKKLVNLTLLAAFVLLMGACKQTSGEKVEAQDAQEVAATTTSSTYTVDTEGSTITWEGTKPDGAHVGTIGLSEGSLDIDSDGNIAGGSFTIDINSIICSDIKDAEKNGWLVGHLKSGDFFDAEKFPTGHFEITGVTAIENAEVDEEGFTATHEITGNLTLKETEKSITFKANVTSVSNALVAVSNQFKIDRTAWGVDAASLKDKLINSDIGLKISLAANAAKEEAPAAE